MPASNLPHMLNQYTGALITIYAILFGFALVFLFATAAVAKVVYLSIQPGQIFGGWQNVLNKLNDAHSRFANAIYRPLGGCELCFSHMIGVISYALFAGFIWFVLGSWPMNMTHTLWINIGTNLIGYLMYVCTSTVLSTLAITRL